MITKYLYAILLVVVSFVMSAQDKFVLSSESKLTIDGTSTVHDWTVTANTLEGSLLMEGNSPKELDFQVVVADIKSERGATMDKKMHAALQKESHPNVLFKLREVGGESILSGKLSIAGTSQQVAIKGKIDISDSGMIISGTQDIVLKDFEIDPPTAMFGQVVVGDKVTVKFELVFEKE